MLNDLADFISQPEIKSMFKDGKAQRIPSSEQAKINEYKQRIATIDILTSRSFWMPVLHLVMLLLNI